MDITPTQVLIYGFVLGLIFGSFPFFLTLREFVGAYFSVRFGKGKRLLAVHLKDGFNVTWKVGFLKDGMWQYKYKNKDIRVFSISDGVALRTLGVNVIHLLEGVTAPFNFKFVTSQVETVAVPIFDKDKNPVLDAQGVQKVRFEEQVNRLFFDAYSDAKSIMEMFESALTKKASRASLSLGGINFMRLAIIAVVVIGGWFVIKNIVLPTMSQGQMVVG